MARPGNLRKAAPRLKLSQPAVNNYIQEEAQASRAGFLKASSEQYSRVNVDISINLRADLLDRNLDLALPMGPVSEHTVQNVALSAFGLHWYLARANPQIDPHALPIISYSSETRPYREQMSELSRRIGPGFVPKSLASTASRLSEPRSFLLKTSAQMARAVATYWDAVQSGRFRTIYRL